MPFTRSEFFAVFAAYNTAIWPLHLLAYAGGVIAFAVLLRPGRAATMATAAILALFWFVNGAGYHWTFFAPINPVARVFAALFVVQAGLLVAVPLMRPDFRFAWTGGAASWVGAALAAFALVVYPLWGFLAGHVWPAAPAFGVAPCPTTIFTLGMLLLSAGPGRVWLAIIPMLWAVVGGTAAVLLGVPQDFGLIAALLLSAALLIASRRRPGKAPA